MSGTIATMWEKYRAASVATATASPAQVSLTRDAFYVGATTMMTAILRATDVDDDLSTVRLDAIADEMSAFFNEPAAATEPPAAPIVQPTAYNVRDPELEPVLRDIGDRIGSMLPEGYGFALFLMQFEQSNLFYISSAERDGMVQMLREWLNRQVS